jgi:hypothetical protein
LLLLAVALLAAQWLLTMHGLHVLAGDGDATGCTICVLGHGLDHTIAATGKTPVLPVGSPEESATEPVAASSGRFTCYRSRAPPSLQTSA